MRVASLVLPACFALQASAGWLGGNEQSVNSAATEVEQAAADAFAPKAGAEATPAFVTGDASEQTASSTAASKPERRRPTILPTPTDWFNGVKPYAWQDYDGLEYKFLWDKLVIRPYLYTFEISASLLIFGFALLFSILRDANTSRAMAWLLNARPHLQQHFAKVNSGKPKTANAEGTTSSEAWLTASSNSIFSCWATGRKHLRGLLIKFELQPRGSDLVGMATALAESVYDLTSNAQDRITLNYYLASDNVGDKAIFSILRKGEIARLRDSRWDVRAFASVASLPQKYSANALNDHFSVFTETGSASEAITGAIDKVGFLDWLKGTGEGQEYFENLTLTDIGDVKNGITDADLAQPDALKYDRQLSITFSLPKSPKKYDQTMPLFFLGLNLADMLSGPSGNKLLSNQETNKIVKRREEIVKGLTKEYVADQRAQQEEEKRAAKKKADDEKYNAMSAAQQKKYDGLKKNRADRKASGRQTQKVNQ